MIAREVLAPPNSEASEGSAYFGLIRSHLVYKQAQPLEEIKMGREDLKRRCSEFDESLRLHYHPYNTNIDEESEESADSEVVEQKETTEM